MLEEIINVEQLLLFNYWKESRRLSRLFVAEERETIHLAVRRTNEMMSALVVD